MLKSRMITITLLSASAVSLNALKQTARVRTEDLSVAAEVEKERVSRKIRFGFRELNLPLDLSNYELSVENDRLEVHVANLSGNVPDTDRLAIDMYELEQKKEAIEVAMAFAQIWSSNDSGATQHHLEASEAHFEDADTKCHPREEDHGLVKFATLSLAKNACANLHKIYQEVHGLHIATPDGWRSVFKDDPGFKGRLGYQLFREDTNQFNRDQMIPLSAKDKAWLTNKDQSIISTDKQIWLMEMVNEDARNFNARYPDQPLDSADEMLETTKKYRQGVANDVASYRKAIHQKPNHVTPRHSPR